VDFDFKNNQLNHGRTLTITNFAQSENNQERKNCSNPLKLQLLETFAFNKMNAFLERKRKT
jgi:hypothetical protein